MTQQGPDEGRSSEAPHEHVESYQGGVQSRHGKVNGWLVVVYVVIFIWALYYGFTYWGGLGPGLNY